ncbi:MAG TPA: GMC family oxidoreductase [Myxococcota bacterium]
MHAPARSASTRRIAERLAEALFPAGEQLPAPDVAALVDRADASLEDHRRLRQGMTALLWWLELRYLATHGRRFSAAEREARSAFLRRRAGAWVDGALLRALSAPLRVAYLLDEENLARMKARAGVRVPASIGTERWRARVSPAADFTEPQEIECDVVVVGTGAGGAAAALELAERGLAVVMVEEGHYFDRRDFSGRLTEVMPKLYRARGATSAIGNNLIPIPIGRSVGGTTTINSGTCLRTPERTLADWRAEGLVDLTPEHLEPFFARVEEILKLQPADPKYVGEIGRVIAEGARRIGMRDMKPLPRNAEGCDGQGLCQFGCPTDAKQSTNVSFVPRALESGAFLYTGFRAERLLREGAGHARRVTGIVAQGRGGDGRPVALTVRARATVVAMGTLLTPNFLRANGVRSRWLGENLSIHPAGAATAWFPDREFANGATIPQGFGVHDLADEGLMFEGGTIPFVAHGMFCPLQAEDFVRFTERYQQTAYFGIMVKDTSRGRVRRGPLPDLPLVTYRMNDRDFALFRRGLDLLARMYFAAGAKEVHFPAWNGITTLHGPEELDAFWATDPKPRRFLMTAYHPLGTARIAADAARGVCDPRHRVYGHEGLYVMDGSSVPTSLGVNPQVTIMALATRAARSLADELGA